MTAAGSDAVRSVDPAARSLRTARLIRVAVLLLAGITITFTATMHGRLGFDVAVAGFALAALGIAHFQEWVVTRAPARTPVTLLLAICGVGAAIALPLTGTVTGFAIVVAAWALASALLEFIGAATRPGSRQDAALMGALGMLLAILVLLVREDQVAILGFFGGYAVIAGVFLGISAFDVKRGASGTHRDGALPQPTPQNPVQTHQ